MDQASRSASVERRNSYRGGDRRDSRDERPKSRSRSRSNDRRSPAPNKSGNVLYVGNLDRRVTDDEVRERFEKYGKIENLQIIKDPQTQECRGFAFVDFANYDDAEEAIKELDQKEFNGRKIRVERSKRGIGYSRTPGQYLGNSRGGRRGGRDYDRRRFSRSRSNDRGDRRRDYGDRDRRGDRDDYRGGDRYNNRDRYNDRPPRNFNNRDRSRSRERRY